MIRAFLFDYDGVITAPVPDGTFNGRISKNLGISPETAGEWVRPIWDAMLKGELTEEQIWQYFAKKYGKPVRPDQRNVWHTWEDLQPLPEMLSLLRRLKAEGYPVGIVSNVQSTAAEDVRRHGGYDEADFAILSCKVGHKKPEPEIFELAMQRLPGIKPEEVLYMDDRQRPIDGAEQFGMQVRLVRDHAALIREIEQLIKEK